VSGILTNTAHVMFIYEANVLVPFQCVRWDLFIFSVSLDFCPTYNIYTGCFRRNSEYFGRLYYRLFWVKSSYKYMPNCQWMRRYSCLKLELKNPLWQVLKNDKWLIVCIYWLFEWYKTQIIDK
jgi:hypothetical protein